jgi:hypothetical protein
MRVAVNSLAGAVSKKLLPQARSAILPTDSNVSIFAWVLVYE